MARREALIDMRKSRGWLQKNVVEELLKRFGISITESYYGMIEQGVRTPKLELALAISNLYECKPDEIFFADKPYKMLGDAVTA
jgi:putative transcriptional regulator